MKRLNILAALVFCIIVTSCERLNVKRVVKNERNAKIVWIREDSCYSITRPLMSARYKASKATRSCCEQAHNELMRLSEQQKDRNTNHGGMKVKCYWVGYKQQYSTEVDSTVVMVEPSGEIVTEMQELNDWCDAAEEIGRITNIVFSR